MIWRHLLGYLPVNIVSGLVAFGVVYAFTRLLGADDYGRYALIATLMHASHTTTLTWAEAAAYRFTGDAESKGGMPDHLRTSLGLAVLSLIPAFLVIGVAWIATSADPKMQSALIWLLLAMPCFSVIQMSLEIHKARQQVKRFAFISMGYTLSGFTLGTLFASHTELGASAPFAGLAFGGVAFAIVQGWSLWQQSAGGHFQWTRVKRYFFYGMPVALALLLEIALGAGDRFLIQAYLGNAAVGAYAAGYGVADQTIRLLCMWGAMAGAPLLMAAYETRGNQGLKEAGEPMARMLVLLAFPAAIGLALVARPLAEFMIGEELREQAIHVIPWIAMGGLMNGFIIYYFAEAFQLAKKTAFRAGLMVIPVVANIGLNIVLLPQLGLMGAVYATVIAYALSLGLVIFFGRRFAKLPIPLKDIALVAIACVAMAGAVSLIPSIGAFPELILKACAGGIAYALAVFTLNAAGARDLAMSFIRNKTA